MGTNDNRGEASVSDDVTEADRMELLSLRSERAYGVYGDARDGLIDSIFIALCSGNYKKDTPSQRRDRWRGLFDHMCEVLERRREWKDAASERFKAERKARRGL